MVKLRTTSTAILLGIAILLKLLEQFALKVYQAFLSPLKAALRTEDGLRAFSGYSDLKPRS